MLCSHLGNRAAAKRERDVLVELVHEHVRRQTVVAQLPGEEQVPWYTVARVTRVEEAPCPPIVSSAKGDKRGDSAAAQMVSCSPCLKSSERFALERFALGRTSLRGSCSRAQMVEGLA